MMLDWMHGDPRLTRDSHANGLLHIMDLVEHVDFSLGLAVLQKFEARNLEFAYTNRVMGARRDPAMNFWFAFGFCTACITFFACSQVNAHFLPYPLRCRRRASLWRASIRFHGSSEAEFSNRMP